MNMWFSNFSQANEWARAQQCGTIRRSSSGHGFDWFLTDEENISPLGIDLERLSTFISYSYNGMTIRCKEVFIRELHKWNPVSEDAQKIIVESDKILAWTDLETGLTWDAALVFQDPHGVYPYKTHIAQNELSYGGFSDWRQPTIHELSTLLTKIETGNGIYIKRPLLRRGSHKSWGASRFEFDESKYFDFKKCQPDNQRYIENDRRGHYKANFVTSRSVRGEVTVSQKSWVNTIARWAAKNNNPGIPLNESAIISLEEIILDPDIVGEVDDLPKEFLQLEYVKSIKIGGFLRKVPELVFNFKKLKNLTICNYSDTKISENIANLKELEYLEFVHPLKLNQLPSRIVELENIKKLLLRRYSTFELTSDQKAWIQRLKERGCIV